MKLHHLQNSQSPYYQHPIASTGGKHLTGNRLTSGNKVSPSIRLNYKSPSGCSKPTNDYVSHLVPHQSQAVRPQMKESIPPILIQHSSLVQNSLSKSQDSFNKFNSGIQKVENIANTPTAVTRSRQSEMSNKKSLLFQTQRKLQYCPPTPNNIKRLQPIRRMSQHKVNISHESQERSNRSLSQQNIKIIIQTDSPRNPSQLPPKITVSHIQKGPKSQKESALVMKNPEFLAQPSVLSQQTLLQRSRHIRPLTERNSPAKPIVRFVTQNRQNAAVTGRFPPFQTNQFQRNHSLSMDNKILVMNNSQSLQSTKNEGFKLQKVSNMERSGSSNFQPQVSFSSSKPSPVPQIRTPSQKSSQTQIKVLQSRKQNRQKATLNFSSQTQQEYEIKKERKACYNDYYGQYEEKESFPSFQQAKKQSVLLLQHKTSLNQRVLINQIFENQTNKALLKIEKIRSKSHQRKFKKSNKH